MNAFTVPQPGERHNAAAIPVPEHTLLALLAAALAWEIDTDAAYPDVVPPQIADATRAGLYLLPDHLADYVAGLAAGMMQARAEAEQG